VQQFTGCDLGEEVALFLQTDCLAGGTRDAEASEGMGTHEASLPGCSSQDKTGISNCLRNAAWLGWTF